jgi:hypothetical protein
MPDRTEKAVSQAMGAVKSVKATFKGMTGVFKHLMVEHGKVSALIMRVSMSSDHAVRAELYPIIRTELLGHEKGELTAVYPALAEFQETRSIAEEHARDAGELEAVIRELDTLSYSDASWMPTFDRLAGLVQKHVSLEESEYFPKAQKTVGDERAKALLPFFEAAKTNAAAS